MNIFPTDSMKRYIVRFDANKVLPELPQGTQIVGVTSRMFVVLATDEAADKLKRMPAWAAVEENVS